MIIIWSERAYHRLDQIFDIISGDNPHAAIHVCKRIEARVSALEQYPHTGRIGRIDGTRELVIGDLPYIVVYSIESDEIRILTIRHTSQIWPQSFLEE